MRGARFTVSLFSFQVPRCCLWFVFGFCFVSLVVCWVWLCVLFLVLFLLTPEGLATSLRLAPLVVMR